MHRISLPPAAVLLVASMGCAAPSRHSAPEAPPSAARAAEPPREDAELPPDLEELELTADQRRAVLALREQATKDVEPLAEASRDFVRAIAGAARHCKPDSPLIEMRAAHAVSTGEQVRPLVLDAINRFHGILTPAQRRRVSERLLGREQRSRERRRQQNRAERSLGADLDLSVGQMVVLLSRASMLRDRFEEQAEPWRGPLRETLEAFARDDFDVRRHAIAEIPVVALVTEFARDAYRVLLPVLEPEQCQALSRLLHDAIEKPPSGR